jgi:ubiquitin C-terminal hydrolase
LIDCGGLVLVLVFFILVFWFVVVVVVFFLFSSASSQVLCCAVSLSPLSITPHVPRPVTPQEYRLAGVLVHTGTTESGHYYSYVKDRRNGKWYAL